MARVTRTRMHAEERREDILRAAAVEFARAGLHGTSTEAIAARSEVSQPYLFRLFGTKKALFLATVARGFDRVEGAFRLAAEREPGDVLNAMGRAYVVLLEDRNELLLQLHAYAACDDPAVRDLVRQRFAGLVEMVSELSSASTDEVREFFAGGMLLNVAAAMDLLPLLGEEWVRCLLPVDEA